MRAKKNSKAAPRRLGPPSARKKQARKGKTLAPPVEDAPRLACYEISPHVISSPRSLKHVISTPLARQVGARRAKKGLPEGAKAESAQANHWKDASNEKKKRNRTQKQTLTAAASAARLRLESAEARTDSGLAIEMRDVVVPYGRGRPPMASRGLRRKAPADAAAAEAEERAAVDEEEALAPLIVVVLGMEARMVAKSREMLRWRMHGFGPSRA